MEDRSRRRARLILIVGVLLALLAGGGTFLVASQTKTEAPPPPPTVDVIVAAREIPPRTALKASDLRVAKYNVDTAPPTALHDTKDLVDKVAVVAMTIGEPVLPNKLAAAGAPAYTVFPPNEEVGPGKPNYRAMSISVGDDKAVAGAIQPGDVVDIMYVIVFDPTKFLLPVPGITPGSLQDRRVADFSAKISLERVPVLARTGSVYTIRTDAATAERLAYMQSSGAVTQMLLRAPNDDRASGTTGATFGPVQQQFHFLIPEKIQQ